MEKKIKKTPIVISLVPFSLCGTHSPIKTFASELGRGDCFDLHMDEGKNVKGLHFTSHSELQQNSNLRFLNQQYPKGITEDHNDEVAVMVKAMFYANGVFYTHCLHFLTWLSFFNQLQSGFCFYHMLTVIALFKVSGNLYSAI